MQEEAAGSFETSVCIYQTTLCHIPEGRILNNHIRDILNPHNMQGINSRSSVTRTGIITLSDNTSVGRGDKEILHSPDGESGSKVLGWQFDREMERLH